MCINPIREMFVLESKLFIQHGNGLVELDLLTQTWSFKLATLIKTGCRLIVL